MKVLNMIVCWFSGHINDSSVAGFAFDDYEFEVSICKRCGATIVYDPDLNIWDKW